MKTATFLQNQKESLKASERMPVVFLGHGSPLNAIEDTPYSRSWTALGEILPKPQAVLAVSAHWTTHDATQVHVSAAPRTIHDFYGFPDALYAEQYPAPGAPERAREVAALLADHRVSEDEDWGLDHGAWSVLKFLYPAADVPVFQLSVDIGKDLAWHLELGRTLSALRDRGVLILGSGNVVHNLRALRWSGPPHDWTVEFDRLFADYLDDRDFGALADWRDRQSLLSMAHPTLEHYIPALTVAGASHARDSLFVTAEGLDLGALSMRSFVFHGS